MYIMIMLSTFYLCSTWFVGQKLFSLAVLKNFILTLSTVVFSETSIVISPYHTLAVVLNYTVCQLCHVGLGRRTHFSLN